MVYPVTDSELVLVKNKATVVLAKVTTTNATEPKPAGSLRVESSDGQLLQTIALTAPTGAIPFTAPTSPSFTTAYSATIPASLINSGVVLKVSLANGQAPTTVTPRVGAENAITLMAVPVRIESTTVNMPTGMAAYFLPKAPVGKVTEQIHATFTSTAVPTFPANETEWKTAMSKVLGEMAALRTSESGGNRTYYYGFLPKTTYGQVGLGYVPGNAAVGVGKFGNDMGVALETMVHELGHNLSLSHAPCGLTSGDPQYPYAGGTLGGSGRYIWGYNISTATFIDATDTSKHDVMSYCSGDSFSDYSYRKMQKHLTPADALYVDPNKAAEVPQELLLISGEVDASGIRVNPFKAFQGLLQLPAPGPYTLRITTPTGTLQYPFAGDTLDHRSDLSMFTFSVPNPGQIVSVAILRGSQVLYNMQASAKGSVYTKASAPQTLVVEQGGALIVQWDAQSYPYLMVTHVGDKRSTLVVDAKGGKLNLPIQGLPAGGRFEFSFSDGLNSVRVERSR